MARYYRGRRYRTKRERDRDEGFRDLMIMLAIGVGLTIIVVGGVVKLCAGGVKVARVLNNKRQKKLKKLAEK